MRLLFPSLLVPLMLSTLTGASNSFAGSSLYYLHGLSDSDQDYYINTLAGYGAKVIRIWVTSLSAGCQKGSNVANNVPSFEDNIGSYNWNTLAALDKVLAKMQAKGMKAIISPHDGNLIHDTGSNTPQSNPPSDIYTNTYGSSFYTNSQAEAQFDARIKAILTYKSPSSGQEWGNWSDAILAFDIQNEPFQFVKNGVNTDPSGWLCGRAKNMKKYLTNSNIKVATGGVGGDESAGATMATTAIQCSSIDLMSIHSYVGTASFWTSHLPQWISTAKANNKLAYVEEWGVKTSYQDDFNDQVAAINSQNIPYVYWQFIPGNDATQCNGNGCCAVKYPGYDDFEIGLTSGKGNVKSAIQAANSQTTVQDWSFAFGGSSGPTGSTPPTTGSYPADTCGWGCEGWDCSSSVPCQSAYSCVGGFCSDCTWGCNGWDCSDTSPCNADYSCVSGICHHSGSATKR